jgi:tetratricopeptide (TPR) repeat protein
LILDFIRCLERGGLYVTAEGILDALWLASGSWQLTIADKSSVVPPATIAASRMLESAPRQETEASLQERQRNPDNQTDDGEVDSEETEEVQRGIYARTYDVPGSGDRSVPATPLRLPAARTLPNRLGLANALRPLRKRFRSRTAFEIDEESTAELTAEIGGSGHGSILPVLRPADERWYEVDIILEDDPAIEIWGAPLREFARVLGESGTFRCVHSWRLRLHAETPGNLKQARLETPACGFVDLGRLGADPRRLVFFASHGASVHWQDGIYPRLLSKWSAGTIALLHLLPAERWARTRLGEPNGLCRAEQPGAPSVALRGNVHWWRISADPAAATTLRLPVTTLEAESLNEWALMQMSRGRETEIYLLDTRSANAVTQVHASEVDQADVERRLVNLQETSPDAVQLALALASAPFTLPVARVVQEAILGCATDYTLLADLLLSGLVSVRSEGKGDTDEATAFEIVHAARAILMNGLRPRDALRIARELELRVFHHLVGVTGRSISFEALRTDPAGRESLPGWARPFVSLEAGLLDAAHPDPNLFDAEAPRMTTMKGARGRIIRALRAKSELSAKQPSPYTLSQSNSLRPDRASPASEFQPASITLNVSAMKDARDRIIRALRAKSELLAKQPSPHTLSQSNSLRPDQASQASELQTASITVNGSQTPPRRAAVVIGVNKIGGVQSLRSPAATAQMFGDWLKSEGFEVATITDVSVRITPLVISDAILKFTNSEIYQQLIIYFAGYAFLKNDTLLWLLSDAPGDANAAVSWVETVEFAKICGVPNVVLISDVCRLVPATPQQMRVRGSVVFPNSEINYRYHSSVDKLVGIASERRPYEIHLEGGKQIINVFTRCLLRAFQFPDRDMIKNLTEDGKTIEVIPNRRLGRYLQREISDLLAGVNRSLAYDEIGVDIEVTSDDDTYIGRVRATDGNRVKTLASRTRFTIWLPIYRLQIGASVDATFNDAVEYIEHMERSIHVARQSGDRPGEALSLGNLGVAYARRDDARRAIEYLELSLSVVRKIGDLRGEGTVLGNLGNAYADLGETRRAIERQEGSLLLARETGDWPGEGAALTNLGNAYVQLGDIPRAIQCQENSLLIARKIDDRHLEGAVAGNLGSAYKDLGEIRRAIQCQEECLSIARETSDRRWEGAALGNLGIAYAALGEINRAVACHEHSLSISREIGDRRLEGAALGNLGIAFADLGETRRAASLLLDALKIFETIESPYATQAKAVITELAGR